jgi:hypothetical protein
VDGFVVVGGATIYGPACAGRVLDELARAFGFIVGDSEERGQLIIRVVPG